MTWSRRVGGVAAVVLALGLAACQPSPDDDGDASPGDGDVTTLTPTEEPTTDPTTDPTQTGPLDERSQAAVDDLAQRLGVSPDEIEVGPLEEVTWRDGAIGCPQPGQSYTQALVPGARLILVVDGTQYAYHGEGDEPLFYCEDPEEPLPSDDATA